MYSWVTWLRNTHVWDDDWVVENYIVMEKWVWNCETMNI